MKKLTILLLSSFLLFGAACDSDDVFGCDRDEARRGTPTGEQDEVTLGEPGKTKVESKLPENDNVIVLGEKEEIKFISEDGKAEIIHSPEKTIEQGNIIIANSEQKYLTRVKEVIERNDGSTQVVLRQGRIQDLIGDGEGSLSIESTPVYDLSDLKELDIKAQRMRKLGMDLQYETDGKGKVIIRDMELYNFNLNNKGRVSGGANRILGVKVKNPYKKLNITSKAGGLYRAVVNEAVIEVIPTLREDADWTDGGKIRDMNVRLDAKVKYRLDITYENAGHVNIEGLLDFIVPKKVIEIHTPPPSPMHLDIELGIPVGVSVTAQTKGKTRVIMESEYEFYTTLGYDKKKGTYTEGDKKANITDTKIETKQGSTKISAEVFLKPQVTARLYRVVGPYGFFKLYGRGEIEWPSAVKKDDLFIGVKGGVGLEISEPIFLTSVASFEVDDLFDFYKAFDLDQKGTASPAPKKLESAVDDAVTIDRIGAEGFVKLQLKNKDREDMRRYQLIKGTQNGLTVPSEAFYMDGELYYYPMPGSESESFTVRIFGTDGTHIDREISIGVTSNVQTLVSMDRYGLTTNSYEVAMGTPGQFAAQVPGHYLGGGVHMVQAPEVPEELRRLKELDEHGEGLEESITKNGIPMLRIKECFSTDATLSVGDMRDQWGLHPQCRGFESLTMDYLDSLVDVLYDREMDEQTRSQVGEELMYTVPSQIYELAARQGRQDDLVQIRQRKKVVPLKGQTEEEKTIERLQRQLEIQNIAFDVFNYSFPGHYVASKVEVKCPPTYVVEPINEDNRLGFRFIAESCPGYFKAASFNFVKPPHMGKQFDELGVRWDKSEHSDTYTKTIEFTVDRRVLHKQIDAFYGGTQTSILIMVPTSPDIKTLNVFTSAVENSLYPTKIRGVSRKTWVFAVVRILYDKKAESFEAQLTSSIYQSEKKSEAKYKIKEDGRKKDNWNL